MMPLESTHPCIGWVKISKRLYFFVIFFIMDIGFDEKETYEGRET